MINPPVEIDIDILHLDTTNPRFGLFSADSEQDALLILVDTANVRELWASISARGFERFEPLIAINDETLPGHYIIIEGNRRLAACKTLLEPELLGSRSSKVPKVTAAVRSTIVTLPVIVVATRLEAESYIGFKHVNGPSTWNSLAKARFGVQMLENAADARPLKERMKDLTQKLGDSRGMLLRVFVAFKIYEQALADGIVEGNGIDTQKLEFSHLYTMLNHPPSREFLGLPITALSEGSVVDRPVPDTHQENLREMFGWLYGQNSVIKRQGSDRPRLQKVLASADGLEALRASDDLDYAYATAGLGRDDWHDKLHQCTALAKKIDSETVEVLEAMELEQIHNAKATLNRAEQYIKSTMQKIKLALE